MTRRFTASSYALSALVILTGLVVACRDTQAPSAPLAPRTDPASLTAEPAYAGSARRLARMIAISMKDHASRADWLTALRASPLTDHTLRLKDFSGTVQGRTLISDVARANGRDADVVTALLASIPAMDVLMPIRAHRLKWTADDTSIVVAALLQKHAAQVRVFNAAGDSLTLYESAGKPVRPVLVITPTKYSSRRISPQTQEKGSVIQDADDGELSGTVTYAMTGKDSLRIDLADVMQLRRVPGAAASDAVTLEPRSAFGTSMARMGSGSAAAAATAPADTTILYAFRVRYDEGLWISEHDEPFFKTYFLDGPHQGIADQAGVIGYGELRFGGVSHGVWYYPNLPLIYSRVADSSAGQMQVQIKESDPLGDVFCGYGNFDVRSPRGDFGRVPFSMTALDWPGHQLSCEQLNKGDTTADVQLYWHPKAFPTTAISVRIVPADSTTHPYFEAGCQAYPFQTIQARGPDNAFMFYKYVKNHIAISSDNPAIAAFVPDSDFVTLDFNSAGTTTLHATIFGASTSRAFTVDPFVGHIAVSPYGPRVPYGQSQQITRTVYNLSNQIITDCGVSATNHFPLLPTTWSTSNAAVATVTSAGLVKSVGVGTATITAKMGGFTAISSILAPPATSFTSTPNAPYNQNVTVTANLSPAGSYYYDWAYSFCNTGHAVGDCDGTYYALPSGINVKTATTKVKNTDRYVIFRLNEKLTSTGTVLASLQYRVDGAGEVIGGGGGGGGGCTPGVAC